MQLWRLTNLFRRSAKNVQDLAEYSVRLIPRLFGRPFYVADLLDQMYHLGVGSLFLVALTGMLAGQGIALQFSIELADFGSKNYLGRVMVISIVRELGPVLTGIMVAARVGAGITAEIGSMKSSEQIDAMIAFGVDPIRKLAVPRFWAIFIMMPILTIICDFVALVGGWVIAVYVAHISSTVYWANIIVKLSIGNFIIGLGKPFLFAIIISVVSTFMGFRTEGGTRGVGRSTTDSVVICSITILFVNFLFTRLVVPYLKGLM